ncbi:MAG: glycosyl hydrolase family 18 protein [Firmicutes bacterium]|nr:glycosyl hydrolase family 18 protein [Bacillota bacterium]
MRRRKQINTLMLSFTVTLIVVAIAAALIWFVILPRVRNVFDDALRGNRDIIHFHEFWALDPETPQIVFDDQHLRDVNAPIIEYRNGNFYAYLSGTFLRDTIDPFLFWDESANTFFASTRREMLEFVPGRTSFYINGRSHPLDTPVMRVNGETFLPIDLVQGLYPLVIEYHPEHNILVITSALVPQTTGMVVTNNAPVRYRAENRAAIAVQLGQDDEVIIFSEYGDVDFVRVRTPQGILGYMAADDIDRIFTMDNVAAGPRILPNWIDNTTPHPPNWDGGRINLIWETAHNQDANANRMLTPFHSSVTVVSPTWFDFERESLNLRTNVSRAYVNWAHEQGVYVWPKVLDSYNAAVRAILMNRDARRTVIDQLIHYVDVYNLDGINIDIEHLLSAEEGPYKIQFLRELAIPMRERGVVLSSAVKVPEPWTMFYRRDLIALTVDFVMVMTYDQHHSTSEISGPVASLSWVQRGVQNILEEVPREQLLMGIPLYNRIWREVVLEDAPPTSVNRTMDFTREFFEERGVEWEWDPEIGSYYGRVGSIEDGEAIQYRVWLECPRSIAAKMQVYVVHDLAGVAFWRRFWENEETWDVIERYFP